MCVFKYRNCTSQASKRRRYTAEAAQVRYRSQDPNTITATLPDATGHTAGSTTVKAASGWVLQDKDALKAWEAYGYKPVGHDDSQEAPHDSSTAAASAARAAGPVPTPAPGAPGPTASQASAVRAAPLSGARPGGPAGGFGSATAQQRTAAAAPPGSAVRPYVTPLHLGEPPASAAAAAADEFELEGGPAGAGALRRNLFEISGSSDVSPGPGIDASYLDAAMSSPGHSVSGTGTAGLGTGSPFGFASDAVSHDVASLQRGEPFGTAPGRRGGAAAGARAVPQCTRESHQNVARAFVDVSVAGVYTSMWFGVVAKKFTRRIAARRPCAGAQGRALVLRTGAHDDPVARRDARHPGPAPRAARHDARGAGPHVGTAWRGRGSRRRRGCSSSPVGCYV